MKILWYVSSHGWGHAARQRELIRIYKLSYPETKIIVSSDVPDWFWNKSDLTDLIKGSPSPIVKEKDGDIDVSASRSNFLDFLEKSKKYLDLEISRQILLEPDIIISDIDPLPFKAAEVNHVPAIGISNFTWDWIMKKLFPDLSHQVEQITDMYSSGSFLKLPLSPDYSPFKSTVNAPLLLGGQTGHPEKAKQLLPSGKLCLIALREKIIGMKLNLPDGYCAVSCLPEPTHENCFNVTPAELNNKGVTFSDLVAACNILITKPGYGIVSQILTTGKKAILLTGRKFPEEKFLLPPLIHRENVILLDMKKHSLISDAVAELASFHEDIPSQKYSECEFLKCLKNSMNKLLPHKHAE